MFERYTEKARRVIFFARYEASRFDAPAIGTEHLLLGLARDDSAVLSRFLAGEGSDESFRNQIVARTPMGESVPIHVDLHLNDACKRVLAYAAEEAARLAHKHIGTEHLLLGLLREADCFAAQMLRERGADIEEIRKKLAADPPQSSLSRGRSSRAQLSEAEREKMRITAELQEELRRNIGAPRSPNPPQPGQTGPTGASFHHYTEKARRAIFFARYEATQLGSRVIETEHLLLGVLREMPAELYRFLASGTSIEDIRKKIEAHAQIRENVPSSVNLPLSEETKRVLAYAAEEAGRLNQPRVGLEHLLLGLLREEGCFAAQMLRERGADPDRIRKALAGDSDASSAGDFGDYT